MARFVRDAIERSRGTAHPLDTERQVFRRYADHPVVLRWLAVRDTFRPRTRVRWLTTSALESAEDWLREVHAVADVGVVWTGAVDFGVELARRTGLRYYGQEGRAADGRQLIHADPSESLIASWKANQAGFDLQPWARQLITMPPQSGKALEQIISRSHRQGQTRAVVVDVLISSGLSSDALAGAFNEARHVRTTITLTQKILRADFVRADPRITQSNRFRWATQEEKGQSPW
jgi:hypothetical protein